MFNPGQIQKNYQASIPLIKNSTHIVLENITTSKSKWDEPLQIPPVLYSKFNVPLPTSYKQTKSYPKSLLDYIKRAYEKCKDQNQKALMEKQLRELVRNSQNQLNQINWDSYPLPQLQQDGMSFRMSNLKIDEKVGLQHIRSKLNEIKLPSSYNIVQQQKPSKAMEIAKKRMQKLQQKLNRANKPEEEKPQRQIFIGFSNNPPAQPPRFVLQTSQSSISTPFLNSTNKPPLLATTTNGEANKETKILKYQINQRPMQKLKDKDKPKEREKQKEKEKELEKERDKVKAKEKQRERQRERQKQKQKEKQRENQKEKNKQKQKEKTKKELLNDDKSSGTGKMAKWEILSLDKLKEREQQINQVAKRFKDFNKLKTDNYQKDPIQEDQNIDFQQVIVGKSQSIEKPYLRITGRPNPETVRPEHILKKALKHFLEKYQKDNNYEYLISQLRSIRQDLTVQHIKNGFTVQVYERNLQISLYEKDIPQFKHCQTTLWQLYCQGHFYTKESRIRFISHQMITLTLQNKSQEMSYMLTKIPENSIDDHQMQQCLKLKEQLIIGNYSGFFAYFKQQGKFIKSLLELYIDKMYVKFLLMICKTCGEKVPLTSLSKLLGEDEPKIQEIINSENGVIVNGFLMLKPSYEQFLKSEHLVTKKVTVLMG